MIDRLSLHHFKSVDSADVEFGPITVLVGNNGSGKSNVVDALRFLRDASAFGLDRAFSDRHGVESVRQWSPTRPYRIQIGVDIRDREFGAHYEIAIASVNRGYQIAQETIEVKEHAVDFVDSDRETEDPGPIRRRMSMVREKDGTFKQQIWQSKRSDDRRYRYDDPAFLLAPEIRNESGTVDNSDELLVAQRGRFGFFQAGTLGRLSSRLQDFQAYTIYPNTLRRPQEPSNERMLAPDGSNLTSVFKAMRQRNSGSVAITQITNALRFILPGLEQISILSVGGFLVPQFHMRESSGKAHKFNVSQISDGTLRVLGLLTALYQVPKPSVIVLEEPEQTVNPAILEVLADAMREVSQTSQIIVTTHSPDLLDHFKPEEVRAVGMVDGRTEVSAIGTTQASAVRDRLFTLGDLLVSEGLHGG